MRRWEALEGAPYPLGAHYLKDEGAWSFALYSKHATSVTLHLYAEGDEVNPIFSLHLNPLLHKTGRVWHCRVPDPAASRARWYAYQIDGPFEPTRGQRFDAAKLLLDPCARGVHFPAAFSRAAAVRPGSNAGRAPLAVLPREPEPFDWGDDVAPRHGSDCVIYELHVRGFTMSETSGVRPDRAGTYLGVVDKIPYLQDLGVTTVELMPVFQCDPQEGSCWGYMPLGFFAPHAGYARERGGLGPLREFREMVRALHAADIEVILDVVLNHTAEGDQMGPTYSFRGIDNSTYYLLDRDRSRYRNESGTGNVLHTANRHVRRLILDALRYWAGELHVDGFRFDLASLFTRNSDGTTNLVDPPIIAAIESDPLLAKRRLIAEVWDQTSYQLGRTFPGRTWSQWNSRYRDDLRRFVRGEPGLVETLMRRLYGSDDLFPDTLMDSCHSYQSVNYVTSHDGFTLHDLVSYDRKHNEANGQDNRDGPDQNYSWTCGWESDDGTPETVRGLRQRQVRNFLALLMLSNGLPMFRAGDEYLNSQGGNNNPYNQDNSTSWLDWTGLERHPDVWRFFRALIAFRKRHPSLGRSRFWRGDVSWHGTGAERSPMFRRSRANSPSICAETRSVTAISTP